jgi:hypothetical protein
MNSIGTGEDERSWPVPKNILALYILVTISIVTSALSLACVIVMRPGEKWDRVIEAKAFVVKNESGKTVAVLGELGFGASLYINDKNGKPRIRMAVSDVSKSVFLRMADESDKDRIDISCKNKAASVELTDEGGAVMCRLVCAPTKWEALLPEWKFESIPSGWERIVGPFGFLELGGKNSANVFVVPKAQEKEE